MDASERKKIVEQLTKKFVDDGKLVEAGFVALRAAFIPSDAPESQVNDMRIAFMAGAQHLFASMMSIMEPGAEPTENDLRRMNLIFNELDRFTNEMKIHISPKG